MARRGLLRDGQQITKEGSMTPSQWRFVLHKGDADNEEDTITYEPLSTESENPKDQIGLTKVPLRLIPPSSLAHLAIVMKLGAEKYGPYNWRKNRVRFTVYLEAALRHILAALDGEDLDEESGQPHTAHAMACMAIVLDAGDLGVLVDDRPPVGCFARVSKELQKQDLEETQK